MNEVDGNHLLHRDEDIQVVELTLESCRYAAATTVKQVRRLNTAFASFMGALLKRYLKDCHVGIGSGTFSEGRNLFRREGPSLDQVRLASGLSLHSGPHTAGSCVHIGSLRTAFHRRSADLEQVQFAQLRDQFRVAWRAERMGHFREQ